MEIKFRGFSEELKCFVYGFYQEVEAEGVGYSYIFWQGHTTPVRADSVAQFTGVYDKNDVEIYDKDQLKIKGFKETWKTKVRFENGGFCIDVEEQDYNVTLIGFLDDEAIIEII